jgi:phenylalanyl-tRNA synthetase beta chain
MGEIHPQVLGKLDFDGRIFAFEIYEEELGKLARKTGAFHEINKMPTSEFDFAVVVDEKVEWQKIADLIIGLKDGDIKEVYPFDVYKGGNIGEDKKSVAFRVVCQAKDKTLGDEEIKSVMEKIVEVLKSIGGEIRK